MTLWRILFRIKPGFRSWAEVKARRKPSAAKAMGLYLEEGSELRCSESSFHWVERGMLVGKNNLKLYASVPSRLQARASLIAFGILTAESGFNAALCDVDAVL